MKLAMPFSGSRRRRSPGRNQGFTLTEILIAMTVFVIMVTGILSANLFGLRMFKANETKLTATEWSRKTFGKITDEVHVCNSVQVGSITNGEFKGLLDGEPQQGTGLLIYPTTDTSHFIIYFIQPADQTFRRTTDQPNSAVILADSVTNTMIFSAQDLSGNVLNNNQENKVIHLTLEFYQPERYLQGADFYKLETSVTRRAVQ